MFSTEITGPIFSKILHDIVALVALFNHAYTLHYPILFLNARAISARGVGNFAIKLVAKASSLKTSKKEGRIDNLQSNTFLAKIVKIGPADPEIVQLPSDKSTTTQNWLPWQRPLPN